VEKPFSGASAREKTRFFHRADIPIVLGARFSMGS